jgi:hypothetical protein
MPTEQGYSNQKKLGRAQFKTVHASGNDSFSTKAIPSTVYQKTAPAAIVAVNLVTGASGQVEFYEIELTAHGASVGDIMKMDTGTIVDYEFEIQKIINANKFYILPIATPVVAEQAEILGFTSQRTDRKGNLSVAVTVNTAGIASEATLQQTNQILGTDIYNLLAPFVNGFARLDFSATNVTSSAYVELDPGVNCEVVEVQIFMSSGQPLYLAFGGAGSEVDQQIIIPGGNGLFKLVIPNNTRLSVKSLGATVSSGELILNYRGF